MRFLHRAIAFVLILGSFAFAHEDQVIQIKKNGVLEGIPPEFGPVSLLIRFNSPKDFLNPVESVEVRLGKRSLVLPPALVQDLYSQSIESVTVVASWYHNEQVLPSYLTLEFHATALNSGSGVSTATRVSINLRTCKIMGVSLSVKKSGSAEGLMGISVPIDLHQILSREELIRVADAEYFKRQHRE